MDLKNTINNTNTQKDKLKIGKRNIDNKLVELGGEQATDLADVVNKMGAMVTENYKKIVIGTLKAQLELYQESCMFNIQNNLNFTPRVVIVILRINWISNVTDFPSYLSIDNRKNNNEKTASWRGNSSTIYNAWFSDVSKEKIEVTIKREGNKGNTENIKLDYIIIE